MIFVERRAEPLYGSGDAYRKTVGNSCYGIDKDKSGGYVICENRIDEYAETPPIFTDFKTVKSMVSKIDKEFYVIGMSDRQNHFKAEEVTFNVAELLARMKV